MEKHIFRQKILKEILAAKEKINAVRTNESLVFVLFSDVHAGSVDDEHVDRLCETLNLLTEEIFVK